MNYDVDDVKKAAGGCGSRRLSINGARLPMKINIGTHEEATKKSKPLSHRVHFQSVASRLGEDEEGYGGYNCDSTIAASCEQPSVDYN